MAEALEYAILMSDVMEIAGCSYDEAFALVEYRREMSSICL